MATAAWAARTSISSTSCLSKALSFLLSILRTPKTFFPIFIGTDSSERISGSDFMYVGSFVTSGTSTVLPVLAAFTVMPFSP